MLAAVMSERARFVTYLIAVVLFALAFLVEVRAPRSRLTAIGLIAAGLAVAFLVPLWDASQLM
jgi:hypothetical protein